MKDFINAALPWVAFGVAIAVVLTYRNNKNKREK